MDEAIPFNLDLVLKAVDGKRVVDEGHAKRELLKFLGANPEATKLKHCRVAPYGPGISAGSRGTLHPFLVRPGRKEETATLVGREILADVKRRGCAPPGFTVTFLSRPEKPGD